jgi:hypothetical protein
MIPEDLSRVRRISSEEAFKLRNLIILWNRNVPGGIDVIKSKKRKDGVVDLKCIFCFIARRTIKLSFQQISDYIYADNHTTIMYYVKRHEDLMEVDKDYQRLATPLINTISLEVDNPYFKLFQLVMNFENSKRELEEYIQAFNSYIINDDLNSASRNLLKLLSSRYEPAPNSEPYPVRG